MHRFLSATTVSSAQDIRDLRDALAFLSTLPGHLSTTSKAIDAHAELAGIYKRIGAGTPVAPPTRIGPAMLFENVKGYPDVRVLVGMLASRERTALLLGSTVEQLPFTLLRALDRRIAPMTVSFPEGAPCQEVVHRALLDIRSPEACCRLQPILCLTPDRISTLGFCVRKIPRPERRTSRFIAYACKALTGSPSTSYPAATLISSALRLSDRKSRCQSPLVWGSIRPFISLLVSSHLLRPWVLTN